MSVSLTGVIEVFSKPSPRRNEKSNYKEALGSRVPSYHLFMGCIIHMCHTSMNVRNMCVSYICNHKVARVIIQHVQYTRRVCFVGVRFLWPTFIHILQI